VTKNKNVKKKQLKHEADALTLKLVHHCKRQSLCLKVGYKWTVKKRQQMWLIEENALVMAKEISLEVDTRWMFDNFYGKQLVTREMSVQFLRGGKSSRKTRLSSLVTTSSSTVSLMVIQLQSSRGRQTTVCCQLVWTRSKCTMDHQACALGLATINSEDFCLFFLEVRQATATAGHLYNCLSHNVRLMFVFSLCF